jgi:UDP-N-acetyl-D-galactosamine dehydrogenase
MGVTFKEDVSDIRNSKVADIINELESYGIKNIDIVDPFADQIEVAHEYGFKMTDGPTGKYDAIVVAVSHKNYINLSSDFFENFAGEGCVFVDIKGIYRNRRPKGIVYWSL